MQETSWTWVKSITRLETEQPTASLELKNVQTAPSAQVWEWNSQKQIRSAKHPTSRSFWIVWVQRKTINWLNLASQCRIIITRKHQEPSNQRTEVPVSNLTPKCQKTTFRRYWCLRTGNQKAQGNFGPKRNLNRWTLKQD